MTKFGNFVLWLIAIPAAGFVVVLCAPLLGVGSGWWGETWPKYFCEIPENMINVEHAQKQFDLAEREGKPFEAQSAAGEMQKNLFEAANCGHEDSQIKLILMQCSGEYGFRRNFAEAKSLENDFNSINGPSSNLNVVDNHCQF